MVDLVLGYTYISLQSLSSVYESCSDHPRSGGHCGEEIRGGIQLVANFCLVSKQDIHVVTVGDTPHSVSQTDGQLLKSICWPHSSHGSSHIGTAVY
eukprot:COSAG01_NODE_3725_length_5760_cov_46.275746_6_plen_96_part_00